MSDVLTLDDINRAIDALSRVDEPAPFYIAPSWIYDDPGQLKLFTSIAQSFHPFETVTVVRQQSIKK